MKTWWLCVLVGLSMSLNVAGQTPAVGSSALRPWSAPPPRPLAAGHALFVDATRGDDRKSGAEDQPLATIGRAFQLAQPGSTIYLRQGVFYENVYIAAAGAADAPITLRSYPQEQVVIDGSIAEFTTQPEQAWVPAPGGAPDEFISARPHRNIHLPVGLLGDSLIGLQTYYHLTDLRADNEVIRYDQPGDPKTVDYAPLYCGPGMWYDAATGLIHARLAHTHTDAAVNYTGQTDPRRLPLIISPFASVPLTLDGARHVVIQDLVIQGGGYDTVVMNLADDITFDNVVIRAGTYGLRAVGSRRLRMTAGAIFGSVAPWTYRSDGSKRDYPGRPHRNISRLNTHALVICDGGREFSVYASPVNDDWEIDHCVFAEAHDGLYLGGISCRFHHNLVEALQDDGLYLSQMYPRHLFAGGGATIHVNNNLFRHLNMPFSFGGPEAENKDVVYIYRNIVDQRFPLNYGRTAEAKPERSVWCGLVMSDHGSPPWPNMFVYQNTFIAGSNQRLPHMRTINASTAVRPRHVFNNLYVHLEGLPAYPNKLDADTGLTCDGNLFWQPGLDDAKAAEYFNRYRGSESFTAGKSVYAPGFDAGSLVADPRFVRFAPEAAADNDYRLGDASPAADAGVALPEDWPDTLRQADAGKPDIGALPAGAGADAVGPGG